MRLCSLASPLFALLPAAVLASACSESDATSSGAGGASATNGSTTGAGGAGAGTTAGTGGAGGALASGGAGGAGGEGAGEPIDPGYPVFPEVIGRLSFAVRTGPGANDGTDQNQLSLCLNATACFPLNVLDVNDFRVGEFDVYHFEDVGLPRADVDRVELRSVNGNDAWRPDCLEVRFDGEPVHCEDALDFLLGNGNATGEVPSYSDPLGLHEACTRCYADPITHGPLVGAVGPTSARVLIRTDATRRVVARVHDVATPNAETIAAYVYPSPASDYAAVIDVTGLASGRDYELTFEVDGELSPKVARFRTAPPLGAKSAFRLAYGSCARFDAQPIFETIRADAPDLFLFGGDNHYGNTPDLQSLWWNYRWGLERAGRAELVAETPSIATWDDHDYVGNNTIGASPGKENALLAFSQYWANTSYGTPATPGVYSKYSYGDVDVFLLDDRYYRSADTDPNGTMLGDGQVQWLLAELAASTATFKLLVTGSIWSPTGNESWTDFPAARAQVFDTIRDEGIGGVVLVGGDVHRSSLRTIERTAAGAYDLPEIIASPLANNNSACSDNTAPDAVQLSCHDAGTYYARIDVDTTAPDPTLTATIVGLDGVSRSTMVVKRSELD